MSSRIPLRGPLAFLAVQSRFLRRYAFCSVVDWTLGRRRFEAQRLCLGDTIRLEGARDKQQPLL